MIQPLTKIQLKPGKYVLAVSGGVDSMTLLDLLARKPDIELIIGHFNHGIRLDSGLDEKLVKEAAKRYKFQLEVGRGQLGPKTNEEQARLARYEFLEKVRLKHRAEAIITAHHQDDLIETALLNIIRGTGRRGLTSIKNPKILRPLLDCSKQDLLNYAKHNKLIWREDTTNQDSTYLRNYLRRKVMPGLSPTKRAEIVKNLDKVAKLNIIIDQNIATLSHVLRKNKLDRQAFALLPPPVADELLMFWLRQHNLRQFDQKTIRRLSIAVKTALPGSLQPVYRGWKVTITRDKASLLHP